MNQTIKPEIDLVLLDYKRRSESGDISLKTVRCVQNSFRRIGQYWDNKTYGDVTKDEWALFQDWHEKTFPGESQFNANKYFTVLIRHLYEKELIKKKVQIRDRFSRRERDSRRKKKNWVFTEEEISLLRKACLDNKELLQFQLGALLGFRISDVCQLSWDRIFVEGVKVPYVNFSGFDDKAHSVARCPLPQIILDLLIKMPRTSKWVFPQSGDQSKHIHTQQIDFIKLRKRAGVSRGTFHSLRHYRLSVDFKNKNLTASQICKMRRVSMQVAQEHYIHMDDKDMELLAKESV